MQLNGPITPPAAANIVGPVPCLPAPGEVSIFGPDVTAHIAVPNLVYCTAVFLFDPVSRARAMVHYNPVSGPKVQATYDWIIRHLADTYNAQASGLTVALFNNTSSSNGTPFPPTMYKTDRVMAFLESALGPAHNTMTASHYKFTGRIGLMDAAGVVTGCVGPAITGTAEARAKRMNWVFAKPKKVGTPKQFLT